jgi:hypothetical protein
MRKFAYAVLFLFTLSGCCEVTETITIDPSGKGTYQTDLDASKLVAMIKTFASQSGDTSTFNQNIDSTISFKSIADTSKTLDPDLKPIFSRATMRIVMKMDSNEFKSSLWAPFDNLDQLQRLQNQLSKDGGGFQAMGNLLGGGKGMDSSNSKGMGGMGNMFVTTWKDHQIQRTVNKARFDSLMKDPTMQQAQQMSAMMGEAKFTTIIHLPRPAVTVTSKASVLSEDRKTVTFERTMSEMFTNPEDFDFTIAY